MIDALLKKLTRLGRDEDGAALIVTLALFMFMYLSCAGVFAVGQQVKNRIHLQNACDAAAYSAAVVQADALSRIATINRAMAWTYVSMTRRQMDYIVYKWLEEACKHHADDENAAEEFASHNCSVHRVRGVGWDISGIRLNGNGYPAHKRQSLISEYSSSFPSYMSNNHSPSFYTPRPTSLEGLGQQIDDDLEKISAMNEAEEQIAKGMFEKMSTAAESVLYANVSPLQLDSCRWFFECTADPLDDSTGYMQTLGNTESDELRFIRFAYDVGDEPSSIFSAFDNGSSTWFVRNGAEENGIRRAYRKNGDVLRAEWEWWSTEWVCKHDPDQHYIERYATAGNCRHSHTRCKCSTSHHDVQAVSYADNDVNFDSGEVERRFTSRHHESGDEVFARPIVLTQDYFGAAGTITVGLACYNENPWYKTLKDSAGIGRGILDGIYGAFNPYKYVEWSWAFSSAKAGYKFKGEASNRRDYAVYWDKGEQSWNLCQSDWDAVFVPVRRSVSMADVKDGEVAWSYGETPPLGEWIEKGDWKKLDSSLSAPSYVVNAMPDLPGMKDAPGNIDWDALANMLYH